MQTLSYGFLKPENGDTGAIFFPALAADVQQTNDHNHNGINSPKIDSSAVAATQQPILAANWVSMGGGTYRQAITMAAGFTYGFCFISFIFTSSGNQVFPTVEKISSTSYYVYTNDNSLNYTAVYAS